MQDQRHSCTRRTVTRPLSTTVPMVETHDVSDSCSSKCYALWCPSSQEVFAVAVGRAWNLPWHLASTQGGIHGSPIHGSRGHRSDAPRGLRQ